MKDGSIPSAKFQDPHFTAKGQPRAVVELGALRTLWFNTGTRCNLSCAHCFMESGPKNESLVWLTAADVLPFLDEIGARGLPTDEIGFTGGEPFLNPHFIDVLTLALERGFKVLMLTNATQPLTKRREALLALKARHGGRMAFRVSLDHHTREGHESERGDGAWQAGTDGLRWLAERGFFVAVAGRTKWGEAEGEERAAYGRLFARLGLSLDAHDPHQLVLFAELDPDRDVPEVSESCWSVVGKTPEMMMCASSRMVVKRQGAARPAVVACTLLPSDPRFELGATLAEAEVAVPLNHPYCTEFCVLGGCSCG